MFIFVAYNTFNVGHLSSPYIPETESIICNEYGVDIMYESCVVMIIMCSVRREYIWVTHLVLTSSPYRFSQC